MIKALMIITMVSGAEYTAKLPTMEQCMKETVRVEKQNDVKSASCIPRTESRVTADVFSQFMDMFFMLEEQRKFSDPCPKNLWQSPPFGENYFPPES